MDAKQLTGSVKVAILLNAIGPQAAQLILDNMSGQDRQVIHRLQSRLGKVPPELVDRVAEEFLQSAGVSLSIDGNSSNKAEIFAEDIEPKANNTRIKKLKAIQGLESNQLFQLIKDEHPQTIALILVHLKPDIASNVLSKMNEEVKSDVAFRIANLDKIMSGMVGEIDRVFEEILKNKNQSAIQVAGGVGRLAEILNQIDGGSAEQIIDDIEEEDPQLADQIKQMMFVFEDIVLVDDKGLQKVLRNVESQELAVALKAASEEVKKKIFKNMPERAGDILREEIEVSGAVRMKDVTDAQQKIARIIQDLEKKGDLIVSGRGGEEFIG